MINKYKKTKTTTDIKGLQTTKHLSVVFVSLSLRVRATTCKPLNSKHHSVSTCFVSLLSFFHILTYNKLLSPSLAGKTLSSNAPTTTTHHWCNYENAIRQLWYCNQEKKSSSGLKPSVGLSWIISQRLRVDSVAPPRQEVHLPLPL